MSDRFVRRGNHPALRLRVYMPEQPKAAVLLAPGFSDHVERHEHVCEAWKARGIAVACWDHRGQGRSEGRRGYVDRFSDYVTDYLEIDRVMAEDPQWAKLTPAIWFGHSTGGLMAIHAALREPGRCRLLALASPFLAVALKVPAWKVMAGRMLAEIWPTFAQPTGVSGDQIIRDPERACEYDEDPLRIPFMTARLFNESEIAQAEAQSRAGEITVPVYCRAAGDDRLVSLEATKRFMAALGSSDTKFEIAQGNFHELHQDPDRDHHIALVGDEILRRY